MSRIATPIVLAPEERATLDVWARGQNLPYRKVMRAKIITMAADGVLCKDMAKALGISRPTVQLWRARFHALRLSGLEKDAPRPGRKPIVSVKKIRAVVEATLHTTPPNATHWSTRSMARAQCLSQATVQRIWKQHNLKPHLVQTFKLSRDKRFDENLYDVVGLYLNPPDKSLVSCVYEKSQTQALDRTRLDLPMKKGRSGTRTHDYKSNGMFPLFASLIMLDGKVIGDCIPRHKHQEFIRFLKKIDSETPTELDLHLIVDNYGTHKHPRVKSWLRRHPRFHLYFIPTSNSWLNLVERWICEITDKRIHRGAFENVPALIATIKDYLDTNNQNPRVFVWSAPVEHNLVKIAKDKSVRFTTLGT